jgi:hypothetical protein
VPAGVPSLFLALDIHSQLPLKQLEAASSAIPIRGASKLKMNNKAPSDIG